MILAVNTESFLDITYDEAALILKQVTGNVRILVVNPKDEEEKSKEATISGSETLNKDIKSPATLSPDHASTLKPSAAATPKASLTPRYETSGNFRIFLSFRFYVKSILKDVEDRKLPFLSF